MNYITTTYEQHFTKGSHTLWMKGYNRGTFFDCNQPPLVRIEQLHPNNKMDIQHLWKQHIGSSNLLVVSTELNWVCPERGTSSPTKNKQKTSKIIDIEQLVWLDCRKSKDNIDNLKQVPPKPQPGE